MILSIKHSPLLFCSLMLLAPGAGAQVYNCDGRWTNQRCSEEPEQVIAEAPDRTVKEQPPDAALRRKLLNAVSAKAFDLRRNYGVETDIKYLNTLCNDPATPIDMCQNEVSKKISSIDGSLMFYKERDEMRKRYVVTPSKK